LADRLPGPEAETVEVHVEACAACQQMLEELTGTAGAGTVREPDGRVDSGGDFLRRLEQAPPAIATPPGQEGRAGEGAAEGSPPAVAGYDVLSVLGRGGMGVVYKARHVRLNRLVALKVVLAGTHAGPDRLARFHVEATTAARLQHPHIVQIHEVGEQDGQPFLALEYVTGGNLAQRLDGTPQPPRAAAELVATLARAVQAAHQVGVVHRDLKPANVLLTEDGTPKLTDFGLAKQLDPACRSSVLDGAGQTPSGTVLGTPSYMAPEQARGQNRAIGPAADIYSLGAILYECLTGRPPFKAATTLDTVLQVMNNEPVPPRQLQPQAPRDLETVCLKCLHKEPGKRYASAAALADDLGRFLRGEPVKARPVGSLERGWRWCRRNPVVAGLLATVALSLLLGTAVALGLAVWALGERDRADREATEANDNARRAYEGRYVSDLRLAQRAWEDTYPDRLLELLQAQQPERTGGVDLRGFEWFYWWRLSHSELLSLPGQYVCFSPEGNLLSTVCDKTTVKIWDAGTGQGLLALPGAQPVRAVCFSPNGRRLATAEAEEFKPGKVKVWDVETGREVFDLKGSAGGVGSLCFSPDGHWLAVGGGEDSQSGEAQVWDARTGELSHLLRGHSRRVELVAFAADGRQLTSISRGPLLRVRKDGLLVRMIPGPVELKRWDVATGKEMLSLQLANGHISALAFSTRGDDPRAGGQLVATSVRDNAVTIWEAETGRQVRVLRGHTGWVTGVAFSPDGKHLVSGSEDKTLKVWDVSTSTEGQQVGGLERRTIKGHPAALAGVAYSPDGQRLASASVDGTVKVWQATLSQEPRKLVQGGYISGFAFSPAGLPAFSAPGENPQPMGLWLASAGSDKTIKLWDWATGKLVRTFPGLSYPATRLVFSPNRKVLAAATSGRSPLAIYPATRQRSAVLGEVKVWDADTGEARPLEQPLLVASDLAISLDGNRLLAVGRKPGPNRARPDDALHIWELSTGKLQHRFPLPATPPLRVCFSRQATQLATAGSDGVIRLFDTGTGEEILHFAGLPEPYGVAFSADGQRLAGSAGERITVWEATTGRQLLTLKGHTARVTNLAFSPDGRRLASAALDNTVRIWEGKTGQELLAPGEHREPGQAPVGDFPSLDGWFLLAFSPDGHYLALASTDGTIRIWDATPPDHP
jgi:WD40 repeat protein/serine/threonine protein kinase